MSFRLAQPLAALIPIGIAIWWWFRTRHQSAKTPTFRFSDIRLLEGLPSNWKIRFRWIPDACRYTAWVCLVIALARPQFGQGQQVLRGQGVDIVFAVDISGSMGEADFAPQNRLEAAKAAMLTFIQSREFDRLGLVVFARDAFQLIPPTLDYIALERALSNTQIATGIGLADGTAIGQGIASAANMLRSGTAASKVIILLTDGANNAGDIGPLTAAQAVAALGIRIYAVGMVASPDELSTNTETVDEDVLRSVAAITQGQYFPAYDLEDLQEIYNRIDSLERSDVEKQIIFRWQEQFALFASAALILLMIERGLRITVLQVIP